MIDLLVAGGGPVGLCIALNAARFGLDVAVAEPRQAPIDKACGEGLMPGAVRRLESLGVPLGGRGFSGIAYVCGDRRAEAPFRDGAGRGIRRVELHSALWSAVQRAGVSILDRAVDGVWQDAESVRAAGVRCRYLAVADGLHSPIRRALGLAVNSRHPRRWGLRRHYAVAPWSDLVEVHWEQFAEAYVTPVGNDCVGVALLVDRQMPFAEQLSAFPALVERLHGHEAGGVRGAGPLWQAASRRVAGRVLLAGDAAGYVDALTGDGIAVGIAAGEALVSAVRSNQPWAYERAWRSASRRYRLLTGSLVRARNLPGVSQRIVPAAQRLPWLFRVVVNELAR